MIVGRAAELDELRAARALADRGTAQVVAIVGEPGVGKTALLSALLDEAGPTRVLRLTGMPSEAGLGYAALAVLCRAMDDQLAALPPRQRRAVDSCLAEGNTSPTAGVDLLALGSGLLTLLAEITSETPVLLLVDDLHWVDPESRRALGFALRRLSTERILVVLSTRTESSLPDGVATRWELSPLPTEDARTILDALRLDLDDAEADGILDRAQGNPLAVVELGRSRAAARTGPTLRPDPRGRPLDGPQDVFADQLAALSPGAGRALLLAASDGRVDLALVAAALRSSGDDTTGIDELVVAGLLVTTESGAALRHPLLAGSVMASAGPQQVRAAHAALATALAAHDAARSLWHRAQATVGPDEDLAEQVAIAAGRARRGGRPDEASRGFELAARLTLHQERRAAWLVDAAESALVSADATRSAALVRLARAGAAAPAEIEARAQAIEGQLGLRLGWRQDLGAVVVEACRSLAPDHAVPLLITMAREAVLAHDSTTARAAVDQLETLGGGTPEFRDIVRAFAELDPGGPRPAAEDLARVTELFARPRSGGDVDTMVTVAGRAMEWGRISLARDIYLQAGPPARATGDLDDITLAAFGVAFCDHTLGAWTSAYARAWEVSELLVDADLPERLCEALLLQAEIDAARGRGERCRTTCARVREISTVLRDPLTGILADRRESLLDLGLGRLDAAAVRLESVLAATRLHGLHHPYHSPVPDLVEVYVRSGRTDDAHVVAQDFLERVAPSSSPLPRARALRITGLLAESGDYDAPFAESVELDLSVGMTFHAARTLLCHGERLRRDRRRVDARARLHTALDLFQRLEAAPWVLRCESELAASGAAVAAAQDEDVSTLLTPQELQVAILVAEGRRNREIAEALFLSLRTVESHLSRVFRKLGVDSRTQLTVRMSGGNGS